MLSRKRSILNAMHFSEVAVSGLLLEKDSGYGDICKLVTTHFCQKAAIYRLLKGIVFRATSFKRTGSMPEFFYLTLISQLQHLIPVKEKKAPA